MWGQGSIEGFWGLGSGVSLCPERAGGGGYSVVPRICYLRCTDAVDGKGATC